MNFGVKFELFKLGPIQLNALQGLDFKLGLDICVRILKIKLKQDKMGDLYEMRFLGGCF